MIPADFDMSVLLAQVLEESGFAESRASKMDVDDFLKCVSRVTPTHHRLFSFTDALLALQAPHCLPQARTSLRMIFLLPPPPPSSKETGSFDTFLPFSPSLSPFSRIHVVILLSSFLLRSSSRPSCEGASTALVDGSRA